MACVRPLETMALVVLLAAPSSPGSILAAQPEQSGERVYARVADSVFLLQVTDAGGDNVATATGFLVDAGLLLTNAHVARAGLINVQIGAIQIPCAMERADDVIDLALCRIPAKTSARPLKLADAEPRTGTGVFAIGNPRGFEKTISQGLFNGHRMIEGREVTQISTPISPGSSGGPILDANADIVGVVMSSRVDGQNLNFAVPLEAVRRFIHHESASVDAHALLDAARILDRDQNHLKYSEEPESEWSQMNGRIRDLLNQAIAGTADLQVLRDAYDAARVFRTDVAVLAARKIIQCSKSPSRADYFKLADALYYSTEESEPSPELSEAEDAAARAIELAHPATAEELELLANIQSQAQKHQQAYATYLRAAAAVTSGDRTANSIYFSLFSVLRALGRNAEAEIWFGRAKVGAVAFQWDAFASFLEGQHRPADAAVAYLEAFSLAPAAYANVCSAGVQFYLGEDLDRALAACRRCIELGTAKMGAEPQIGTAHRLMSAALNARAVYDQAVSHAKEALAIDPNDGWASYHLSQALEGQRRFTEAVAAAQSAIRATDGRHAEMHFQLGSALFDLKEWPEAAQAFQTSAELEPTSADAAYNVAVSFHNQQRYQPALTWYREVLRRDPNYKDKDEILITIQKLRPLID